MTTQELTKQEQAKIVKYSGLMDDADIVVSDIIIPKLLLMQQMSRFVTEDKARSGEFRSSLDGKLLADKDEQLEIIPFKVYKTWITFSKQGNDFIGQEPFTLANANKPREETLDIDGRSVEVKNMETLNYYCLLPDEIKTGVFMPYVISFRSTGYMAGKTLETYRIKLKEFNKPLCFKTFNLGCEQREKDNKKYYAMTISEARNTTDQELDAVKHWMNVVKQNDVKVDESEFEAAVSDSGNEKDVSTDDIPF